MEDDVRKAQQGDRDAFTRLIKNMEGNLYRIASSILKSDQEKLDAAQEAIIKAYVSLPTLNHPRFFKTWMIRILIRECMRIARSRKKVIPIGEMVEPAADQRFEHRIELQDAIDRLEEDHRIVILLHYMEDLSIKDIAEILEQKEGTIKSRLSRARNKLSQLLSDHYNVGGFANERI
jgi:RNA polymerase sigma-70 factor (ECF subfamily)